MRKWLNAYATASIAAFLLPFAIGALAFTLAKLNVPFIVLPLLFIVTFSPAILLVSGILALCAILFGAAMPLPSRIFCALLAGFAGYLAYETFFIIQALALTGA